MISLYGHVERANGLACAGRGGKCVSVRWREQRRKGEGKGGDRREEEAIRRPGCHMERYGKSQQAGAEKRLTEILRDARNDEEVA